VKLCVLNYSGNVGKSTIAKHLLAPRLDDCEMLNVESINADESDEEAIRGRRFRELTEMLDLCDSAVVDVGSSNVEDFLLGMQEFRGSHEDYDAFIVPATPPKKQQRDTVSTISALGEMGVEPERIRIVLNWVEHGDEPRQVFASLIAWSEEQKLCAVPRAVVGYNELFSLLRDSERTIADLLKDKTDYRGAMRATSDSDEKLRLSRALAMRRLALGVKEDLDEAWDALWEDAA
jgi:hypothetical protein